MIELISSALTPIIAITVTYIAYKQYKIDKDNLRLALYEKRFKVYQSVRGVISYLSVDSDGGNEEYYKFLESIDEGEFLFDNEISEYLENIRLKVIRLKILEKKLKESPLQVGDERTKFVNEEEELVKWFSDQIKTAKELFSKYLSFDIISK